MGKTIRKLHPRIRQQILRVDINPRTLEPYKVHPNWIRRNDAQLRGQDGLNPSAVRMNLNNDRYGNTKKCNWTLDWTGSRNISRRYVNRIQRAANKRKIYHGIHDYYDALEDEGKIFNFMGVDQDELDDEAWYEAIEAEYIQSLLDEEEEIRRLEEEMDREARERDLDDYFYYYELDYDYSY